MAHFMFSFLYLIDLIEHIDSCYVIPAVHRMLAFRFTFSEFGFEQQQIEERVSGT